MIDYNIIFHSESCGLAVEHSAHDQKVVGSIPMLVDGSGVKAMPGSITTPNSGSLQKNKKIQVAKWGTQKKSTLNYIVVYHSNYTLYGKESGLVI